MEELGMLLFTMIKNRFVEEFLEPRVVRAFAKNVVLIGLKILKVSS